MDAAQQEAATLLLWMIIVGTIVTGVVGSAALGWLERRAMSPRAAAVTSIAAPVPDPARNAVFPDTYQAEPPANHPVLSGTEPVPNRDADIIYLARRVDESGAYVYSANKIGDLVGGQRSETLAKIRAARGEPEPAPDPATHIRVDGGQRWIPREG